MVETILTIKEAMKYCDNIGCFIQRTEKVITLIVMYK